MKRNEKIKQELKGCGINQWELAAAVGVSEQTMYRWLRAEIDQELHEKLSSAIGGIMEGRMKDESEFDN